jgi:hypothetical protein
LTATTAATAYVNGAFVPVTPPGTVRDRFRRRQVIGPLDKRSGAIQTPLPGGECLGRPDIDVEVLGESLGANDGQVGGPPGPSHSPVHLYEDVHRLTVTGIQAAQRLQGCGGVRQLSGDRIEHPGDEIVFAIGDRARIRHRAFEEGQALLHTATLLPHGPSDPRLRRREVGVENGGATRQLFRGAPLSPQPCLQRARVEPHGSR